MRKKLGPLLVTGAAAVGVAAVAVAYRDAQARPEREALRQALGRRSAPKTPPSNRPSVPRQNLQKLLRSALPDSDEVKVLEKAKSAFGARLDLTRDCRLGKRSGPECDFNPGDFAPAELGEWAWAPPAIDAENKKYPGLNLREVWIDSLAEMLRKPGPAKFSAIVTIPTSASAFHALAVHVWRQRDFNSVVIVDPSSCGDAPWWQTGVGMAFAHWMPTDTLGLYLKTSQQLEPGPGCLPFSISIASKMGRPQYQQDTEALHAINRSRADSPFPLSDDVDGRVEAKQLIFMDGLPLVSAALMKHADAPSVAKQWVDLHGGDDPIVNKQGDRLTERVARADQTGERSIDVKRIGYIDQGIQLRRSEGFARKIIQPAFAPFLIKTP
jgi:hypothetical protein